MAGVYPRRFGKYVLLKPMARGGMGEIYLAATGEGGLQKFCVIKTVISEKTDQAKANRFLDEAKVVLRLSHANLVPTFDAGEIDGEFYIAMDLIEGKDLREIWNRCVRTRTRIPLDVALHLGREIARALAYVHSYGDLHLVHRDVAPPNILLSYFGEVKLTDFGLARSVLKQEHTAPGVVFGRASYLAPEQARGEVADARTDVYSLGIVLWELLTGNQYLQLASLDPATAMSLVRHPRVERPSSKAPWIGKELDELLMRALAPERADRFQSAEEMRQALSEVMAKFAPRADVERTAAFVRSLYESAIREERAERDQLLAAAQAQEAAAAAARPRTPVPARAKTPPRATPTVIADEPDTERVLVAELPSGERPTPQVPLAALDRAKISLAFPSEDEVPSADFTGRVIDNRYRVLRKIGEGGMGTVYVGEHVEIGKGVAIKILHPAFSTQQELVERFRREARAASRIGHPNIIDVTDFGTTEDGCAYFVMEHLDGIDLADILTHERRLEHTRACQIAIQICRALAAAHSAGVVHRDLKPENIFLVSRDGKADFVKVLDFGIARSVGRSRQLTNPGVAMGTPEYMAPEQAQGGVVDRRSDIYSVGALLYEMVTGSAPQVRNKELIAPRVLRNELPDEIDRIIVRALEPDPERRYQTMTQLEYDIIKGLWGRPRAVNELLGLRVMRRRAETTPQKEPPPPFAEVLLESFDGRVPGLTPASGLTPLERAVGRAQQPPAMPELDAQPVEPGGTDPSPSPFRAEPPRARVPSQAPLPRDTYPPAVTDEIRRGGGVGRRFVGTFVLLMLAAMGAVVAYRKLPFPWNLRAAAAPRAPSVATAPPPPPVRSEAELRAERIKGGTAEVERLLAGDFGFAQLGPLEALLSRLRTDGAVDAADGFAGRAQGILVKAAEAELDGGEVESGTAHYKAALRLNPEGMKPDVLADALRARAQAARAAKRRDPAVRYARELVALDDGTAAAHLLLAEALSEADADEEAIAEYRKAEAGLPGERRIARQRAKLEKRLAASKRHKPAVTRTAKASAIGARGKASGAVTGAEQDEGASGAAREDKPAADEGDAPAKSAPSEPTSE